MADQLRFKRVDANWWRAFRGTRIYDLFKAESAGEYRAAILQKGRGNTTTLAAEKTPPLSKRGSRTQLQSWLEADGYDSTARRPRTLAARTAP